MSRQGGAGAPTWWVWCEEYQAGPFRSPEAARRRLEAVRAAGACHEPVRVVRGGLF